MNVKEVNTVSKKNISKKKIVYYGYNLYIFDSTDFLIIQEDNEHIDDKYVNYNNEKHNNLKKDDLLIRELYWIDVYMDYYCVTFRDVKNYFGCSIGYYEAEVMKDSLNTEISVIDFDNKKRRTLYIFSNEMEVKIDKLRTTK